VIGTSPRRKEDRRLLVGAGRFVDDLARPDLLHLAVVRSRESHARLIRITTDAARAVPGVVAVWTGADLDGVAPAIPAAYGGSHKGRPFAEPILARHVVRYVGEPIGIVIATDAGRLADALELVGVEYEPLPPLLSPATALHAPTRLHERWPDNAALIARGATGDVDEGFAVSDLVVHERFRHPRLSGMALETRGALAVADRESGRLVVYASHQNPYRLRDAIAAVLGLPSEHVRVVMPDVGGGFGPKGSIYVEEILVAAAARRLGRPVKWVESRREHLMSTGHDRDQHHEIRAGFRQDGTLAAIDSTFLADVGAYPVEGDGLTLNTVNHLCAPYRVAHYRGAGTSVVTNKTPNAAYRGAGRPEAAFVMERVLDVAARRLGLDAAEIRRRNLILPREMPYRPGLTYKDGVPIQYDPGDFGAAFERALTLLDYEEWRARQTRQRTASTRIGIGLACYLQGSGLGPYEGATVRVDPSGKVYVYIGVAAQGQGHATTLAQIAAAEIGVSLDDVIVIGGDTAQFPFGMGTGGSRVTANAGPAVALTAREVRARARAVAADVLECAPDDVRIENGVAHVVGVPGRSVTLGQLAHAAIKAKSLVREVGEPGLNACTYFAPGTVTWAFGTQAAVVEVDLETCAITLLRYVVVHDPGRAINPAIVEGQLQGGAVQGLAAGLLEEIVYDGHGQLVSGSLMDYAIVRAADVPFIIVSLEEHRSMINELGIKGVGESGAIPGAAAIANAVEDAVADLGVMIREVPITPTRLFALMEPARLASLSRP
jgi:carbon-monoxide dehydrogenase large subunit